MAKKTIDDVRRESERWHSKWQDERKRAEAAEAEVIKQKARADAYHGATIALIDDMKRLGFTVAPSVVNNPGLPQHGATVPRCGEPTGENTKCDLWQGHTGMHRPGEG